MKPTWLTNKHIHQYFEQLNDKVLVINSSVYVLNPLIRHIMIPKDDEDTVLERIVEEIRNKMPEIMAGAQQMQRNILTETNKI